jgi:hypothetical protein
MAYRVTSRRKQSRLEKLTPICFHAGVIERAINIRSPQIVPNRPAVYLFAAKASEGISQSRIQRKSFYRPTSTNGRAFAYDL